ncbi:MAG: 50S ribosomal protein L32 [Nitrospirae bacterium CG18_big_fil_WC_8_21_14_2_50_70_55]|nr:50S ribosomal protein L32 [Deltaproteobacteria bacterium]OIP67825.1 MAG: 50S ribosomal protein L32 [Nitrospirae bacterium CG2_30_70_394]PIQ07069.1 MAG: 50S ribosomal protein L32 [Nitrospirae bacterium CG18_big_fil_WC_8_21_14_2_50_70_55]PIU78876.1 MAG: 50S ribosomal protein L32 [Nitrospirae bacterium CG06_land_8_20_14_3_00_70_43]PIW82373.1 MAG: 50S ribosomal protein L32 [Nitrospirae bacterium CG_4_8_14_3_um_filter_70_85]PIX82383.1 MAG: 50S ribosomal protein L32 [Nitrospirae bacterium CG_4_10
MAVPKRKTSRCSRDQRRTHDALTAPALSICPECKEAKQPHIVCPHCGSYRGRKVIEVESF